MFCSFTSNSAARRRRKAALRHGCRIAAGCVRYHKPRPEHLENLTFETRNKRRNHFAQHALHSSSPNPPKRKSLAIFETLSDFKNNKTFAFPYKISSINAFPLCHSIPNIVMRIPFIPQTLTSHKPSFHHTSPYTSHLPAS